MDYKNKKKNMKKLKPIIESLLDDEDDLASNDKFIIEEFLKKNYMPPKNGFVINDDNTVDVKGDLILKSKELEYLTNGFFKFNKVDGFFSIELSNIKSLEGGPRIVVKDVLCCWCKNLTSLEGAPEKVGKNFICAHCNKLVTLEGAPKKVGGDFDCRYCPNLTSYQYKPEEIKGNFQYTVVNHT